MAKGNDNSRSLLRLLFWEGLALAGFLHFKTHPIAAPLWSLNFLYNALFFLVAYPLLFVYRWKMSEGCLNMVLWPLSFLLSWGLGLSLYLWLVYGAYVTGSPFFGALTRHEIVLGALFALVYFPLLQPLLGTTQRYFSLGQSVRILFFAALGGIPAFLLGKFVMDRWGGSMETGSQFLIWLALILIGSALGALVARQTSKK